MPVTCEYAKHKRLNNMKWHSKTTSELLFLSSLLYVSQANEYRRVGALTNSVDYWASPRANRERNRKLQKSEVIRGKL